MTSEFDAVTGLAGGQLGDVGHGLQEVAQLLHGRDLAGELARFADGRAVVVGRVHDRRGQPAPGRAAERHVHVLQLDPVGHVGQVELALVSRAVERALVAVALALPGCAAPRVEVAAAELGLEAGRGRAGAGAALGPAGAVVAPVRWGAAGRRVAVERVQVVAVRHREAARHPVAVAALVVVVDRHRDAVRADLGVQVRHVVDAGRAADVGRVLVLDLVQQQRAAAVGELVPGQDAGRWRSATRPRSPGTPGHRCGPRPRCWSASRGSRPRSARR